MFKIISVAFLLAGLTQFDAQARVVYVAIAQRFPDIVVTGTTDAQYAMGGQHIAKATVTMRSPSGRTMTRSASNRNLINVTFSMLVSLEDGAWTAENIGIETCQYAGPLPSQTSSTSTEVAKFVTMEAISASPPAIARTSSKSQIEVKAVKSLGCEDASVSLQMNASPSGSSGPQFKVTPSLGSPITATFAGAIAKAYWEIETLHNNPTGGKIDVSGLIASSISCTIQSPSKLTLTPQLDVSPNTP